jgi:hypothetical protein
MWLMNIHGLTLQRTDSGKSIHSWLIIFPHFLLETGFVFVAVIGFLLLTEIRNWQTARANSLNCGGRLIPAIGTIAASLFLLSADWLPALSYLQGALLKWISHIFLFYAV